MQLLQLMVFLMPNQIYSKALDLNVQFIRQMILPRIYNL